MLLAAWNSWWCSFCYEHLDQHRSLMMRFPKILNNLMLLFHNLICIEVRTDWVLKMICIYNWRCLIMPAIGPEIPCHSHNQSDENVKPITTYWYSLTLTKFWLPSCLLLLANMINWRAAFHGGKRTKKPWNGKEKYQ